MKIREWARYYVACEDCGKLASSTVQQKAHVDLEAQHLLRGCKVAKKPRGVAIRPAGSTGGSRSYGPSIAQD